MDFSISDHLIIPYGVEKWRIEDIRVTAVSTSKTYFHTDVPIVHIDKHNKEPLRVGQVAILDGLLYAGDANSKDAFREILTRYATFCDQRSRFETLFLQYYCSFVTGACGPVGFKPQGIPSPEHQARLERLYQEANSEPPRNYSEWVWAAIFPIPQAHLHLTDPLRDRTEGGSHLPQHMIKVDFAFWLGDRFLALEIDGSSHVGDEKHILRDRWLQRAGVEVIHVLNDEIEQYKQEVIRHLLPAEISSFWTNFDAGRLSQIDPWDAGF